MKKPLQIFLILKIIFLSSCGFKILDNTEFQNFYINKIETNGDAKINFYLKNDLSSSFSNKEVQNIISMIISSKKEKNIKEKNIKNQITKYELTLISDIELLFINQNMKRSFTVTQNGDYDVDTNQATTITNQDNLEKNLSKKIGQQILNNIRLIINDI